jgi:hypothetical protein
MLVGTIKLTSINAVKTARRFMFNQLFVPNTRV